jgi:hypothetical protein
MLTYKQARNQQCSFKKIGLGKYLQNKVKKVTQKQ